MKSLRQRLVMESARVFDWRETARNCWKMFDVHSFNESNYKSADNNVRAGKLFVPQDHYFKICFLYKQVLEHQSCLSPNLE